LCDRQRDGEHGTGTVRSICGDDRAAHRFDKASRNREPKAGSRPHLIALLHAVEFVEDALEIFRRNALTLVQNLEPDFFSFVPSSHTNTLFPCTMLFSSR